MKNVFKNMFAGIGRMIGHVLTVVAAVMVIGMILVANGLINNSAKDSHASDAFIPAANTVEKLWVRAVAPATVTDYGLIRVAKAYKAEDDVSPFTHYAVAFGHRWIHVWSATAAEEAVQIELAQK